MGNLKSREEEQLLSVVTQVVHLSTSIGPGMAEH